MEVFSTACPRNCYSTCSFMVHVEDGCVVHIDPHPANRATPEGICLKGLSYVERANSPDRILYPLKKQGDGFIRISWDKALDTIAEKLRHYRDAYGPHSILFYYSSGMSGLLNDLSLEFWKLFGGCTRVYGNLCWPAGLEATRLTLGEIKHNAPWDLENAGVIILWGKNPAETNIQEMIPIEKAQQKGARLIVIDPRRSQSSERAEMLFRIRPGTDAALALAIANWLIRYEKIDRRFIDDHVLGFGQFRESIRECSSAWASGITGIPADSIEMLASVIGSEQPMTIIPGFGMQRFTNGGQTIRALLALQVITGNIGKPGACWHYANLQSYVFDAVKEPLSYYPDPEKDMPFRRTVSIAGLGADMLHTADPPLKMAWVERGNPVTQNPDTNAVLKAFRALEFRVVVEQFMTDTALEADLILPAKNMFEQSDIIGSYWNPYVQLMQKVVEPAGEVKPETEIYYLLAQRLGLLEQWNSHSLPAPTDEGIENYLKTYVKKFPEISWVQLKQGPVMAPGNQEIAFSDYKFNTPSGKIELLSGEAARLWGVDPLPAYVPLKESPECDSSGKFPLFMLSPNTKNRIHSQFNNLQIIRAFSPAPEVLIHPDDAAKRNIQQNDKVRIFNERGAITVSASLTHGILPGCISVSNGWWHSTDRGNVNFLSAARETDMGHGTAFHDNRVEIEKVE